MLATIDPRGEQLHRWLWQHLGWLTEIDEGRLSAVIAAAALAALWGLWLGRRAARRAARAAAETGAPATPPPTADASSPGGDA